MNTRFTNQFKLILSEARKRAQKQNRIQVEVQDLFDALTNTKGSLAFELMHKLGLVAFPETPEDGKVYPSELTAFDAMPEPESQLELSDNTKKVIKHSVLLAAQFDHQYVGTEHLLLSIVENEASAINNFVKQKAYTIKEFSKQIEAVLRNTTKFNDLTSDFISGEQGTEFSLGAPKTKRRQISGQKDERMLDFFATDLTDSKFQNHTNPVIGRATEIARIVQILARRDKNNPVLLGEPGVGKTAIIEGLAKRIINGDVPESLLNKKIFSLDLSLLVAGAMYRGEFEGRLKQLLDEIREDPNIILFIDELHTIVGAGAAAGSLDAANILKPSLARGEIRLIGATTLEEYKKHIETDSALERRLQPVIVAEPSIEQTQEILQGIKEGYEKYHGVIVTQEAIEAAAQLSNRYLPEKFLPDKAIDLIDEAAAKKKVKHAPRKEYREIKNLELQLAETVEQKRSAVEQENFPDALSFKEQERRIQSQLDEKMNAVQGSKARLYGEITEHDVTELISQITGIPVGDLMASDMRQLRNLEKSLSRKIIGQHEALVALSTAIKRSKVGLASPHRPQGSFMFLGPTGVGKTETAKVLAQEVFGDEKALIRFDMSEFSSAFNISRLIGSPAGYVGYREGGQLTEAVRRRPYAVVLFDEIEKAHPEIFNVLLQILDEGHLTDAAGKTVDFKNTIIILTSNVGLAEFNEAAAGLGFEAELIKDEHKPIPEYAKVKNSVMNSLKRKFKPEFLNRLDNIIVYQPLTHADIKKIVSLEMKKVSHQLLQQKINVAIDRALVKAIAEKSFIPAEGARAVRRTVEKMLVTPLADKILNKEIEKDSAITLSVDKNNRLAVSK